MKIDIIEVLTNKHYKEFARFVYKVYKGNNNYIPPLLKDEIKAIKKESNPSFNECDAKFWIAKKDNETVGRIGAIINKNYNKLKNCKQGRFSRFECVDDFNVAEALLKTAEEWLKEKGMDMVYGPLGFNNLDPQGLLIEGHEFTQSLGSTYHPEYYKKHIEKLNYQKDIDWVEYKLELTDFALKKAEKGANIIKKRFNVKLKNFKTNKELYPYAEEVFKIVNESFAKLHYVSPFNEELKEYYSKKYFKLLNPEFIKLAEIDGKIVSFYITMPSAFNAMRKINGKINIFNFYHLLRALKAKNTNTLEQLLAGVLPEYSHTGAIVVLMDEVHKLMIKNNLKYIETTGMFEDNHNVLSTWKSYNTINKKLRRAYKKNLN